MNNKKSFTDPRILLLGISILTSVCCELAQAKLELPTNTKFIGIDLGRSRVKMQQNFGEKFFRKNTTTYTFFGGIDFTENFGLEFGFEQENKRKSNNVSLGPGEFFPGGNIQVKNSLTNNPSIFNNIILKLNHKYIGLTNSYKIYDSLCLTSLLGINFSKVKAEYTLVQSGNMVFEPSEINAGLYKRSFYKKKVTPTARFGIAYTLNSNIYMRGNMGWKKLSNIAINSGQNGQLRAGGRLASNQQIKFKDCITFNLGILYRFY